MRCSQLERFACLLIVLAFMAAPIVYSSNAGEDSDIGAPGFDMRDYSKSLSEMAHEYPRQWTQKNDYDLKKIYYPVEWRIPFLEAEQDALPSWTQSVRSLIGGIRQWENVFFVRYGNGEVLEFTPPRADAFLVLERPQSFVVFLERADSSVLPIIKESSADLGGSDGIRLRLGTEYPALVRLSVSGIKLGENSYPFALFSPEGNEVFRAEFTLRGIEPGRIKIRIVDEETSERTEALVSIYSEHGREFPPNASPFYVHEHTEYWRPAAGGKWPVKDSRVSIVPGPFEMPVYPGRCRIVAAKGPEYRILDEEFDVAPGSTVEKTLTVRRYVNLRKRGWYSGDDHCHIGRTPARDRDILDLLAAVDLSVANIVQAGDEHRVYFLQSTWGETSRASRDGHMMAAGQEDPRTAWRGHTLMYDIQNSIHNRKDYYVYEDAFKEARRQGGLTGYAHSAWAFKARLGTAVSVPLNLVDFIELDTADKFAREALYHFWNLGFKLTAMSGSDFPWAAVPGSKRFYAYVDGEFSFEKYMESLRAGHTFTSGGGAFIDIRANGRLPGSIMKASPGEAIRIRLSAAINPEFDLLDRVELVCNGEVIETIRPKDEAKTWLEHETSVTVDESCWLAARVFGKTYNARQAYGGLHPSNAHTTPFFVEVDGKPFMNRQALETELAEARKSLAALEAVIEKPEGSVDPILMERQRQRLLRYVKQAREVYDELEEGY